MTLVTCGQFANFDHPAAQYDQNSSGLCRLVAEWYEKYRMANKKPGQKAINDMQAQTGGDKLFMPFIERYCVKFEPKA